MTRCFAAAAVLLVVLAPVRGQTADEKKQSIKYLQGLQTKDGGFLTHKDDKAPTLRATSSAIRALHYFGGDVPNAKGVADFVASCFDANTGGFKDTPDGKEPGVALTAVGLMAVTELKMPQEKYVEPAVKYLTKTAKSYEEIRIAAAGLEAVKANPEQTKDWLKEITSKRNEDGSYGKGEGMARLTGGSVVIELRLGAKPEKPDAILKVLRDGQRKDGGWGDEGSEVSDLESTYRVMRAFHMLKAKPDVKALRQFVAKCRMEDGSYGTRAGVAPGTVSGTYYASIILHWLDND